MQAKWIGLLSPCGRRHAESLPGAEACHGTPPRTRRGWPASGVAIRDGVTGAPPLPIVRREERGLQRPRRARRQDARKQFDCFHFTFRVSIGGSVPYIDAERQVNVKTFLDRNLRAGLALLLQKTKRCNCDGYDPSIFDECHLSPSSLGHRLGHGYTPPITFIAAVFGSP